MGSGIEEEKASRLARESGCSLAVLKRRLVPSNHLPEWSQSEHAVQLAPLVLAGGWDDSSKDDQGVVERLSDCRYEEILGSTPINRTFLKSPIMGERNVMTKRRKFSAEFKREAVQLANHPGVTKTQIARELGINSNLLGRWCRQLHIEGSRVFVGKGYARNDEMARLKRELARVKKERDFLKEAAAYFAKESS